MSFQNTFNNKPEILTVSELNHEVAQCLENAVAPCWIRGELSSFTQAASGHCYFNLKDESAVVRAVMFRSRSVQLDFNPKLGDQVEVWAQATLYEARGDYQLQVEKMRRAGLGNLHEAFLRIRDRLKAEGLFEHARKLPVPPYPQRIGVVTSLQAAALHDVLTTLQRRAANIEVIVYPAIVQGTQSAASLVNALATAQERQEVDLLLLVRGGGSLEDLWSFNDETLARVIAHCSIPIISGVGHETDTTISDFVASLRAPTPTAAAELASAAYVQARQTLLTLDQRSYKSIHNSLDQQGMRLDYLVPRIVAPAVLLNKYTQLNQQLMQNIGRIVERRLVDNQASLDLLDQQLVRNGAYLLQMKKLLWSQCHQPLSRLAPDFSGHKQHIVQLLLRLQQSMSRKLEQFKMRLQGLEEQLQSLNPRRVLQRGFTMVYDDSGNLIKQAAKVQAGQTLEIEFVDGKKQVQALP